VPNLGSPKKLINYKAAFIITAIVFVSLAIINLVSTNALATQGFAVSESETRTLSLEKENRILSVKIEEATRLKNLEAYAQQSGYIRSKSIVFVPTPPTFASR
jgi:hypothetical protein